MSRAGHKEFVGSDMGFMKQGACLDSDPDLFFPAGSTGPAAEDIERAKAICRGCPVIKECLDYALATDQIAGIWGGTTEEERRALKRQ